MCGEVARQMPFDRFRQAFVGVYLSLSSSCLLEYSSLAIVSLVIVCSAYKTDKRLIRFSNSRTFPGQEYS